MGGTALPDGTQSPEGAQQQLKADAKTGGEALPRRAPLILYMFLTIKLPNSEQLTLVAPSI